MNFEEALELPINQNPSRELLEQGGPVIRKSSPEAELVILVYADGTRSEVKDHLPVTLNLNIEELGIWMELDKQIAELEGDQ